MSAGTSYFFFFNKGFNGIKDLKVVIFGMLSIIIAFGALTLIQYLIGGL